jgi:predicted O-methyltransferase YrrM
VPGPALDPHLLAVARAAPGFLPEDEGVALHAAAVDAARLGPLLEIGTWCGKSAVYLGAAARAAGTVAFTVDHHRGSEEQQPGWPWHDPALVDPDVGLLDTLPCFRRTIHAAGLADVVIAVVGDSPTVARHWATPLGMVFVDGGHGIDVVRADAAAWAPKVVPGGALVFHDVFDDPADGGQAPRDVMVEVLAGGDFAAASRTGSLAVLRRRGA